ncbi:MAG TPA: CarD family transcriptional regulator [Peptococcaceae bacterium]|nr:CarD family transcriptional regulator [Peptococcaceae bacterium]
MFLVGDKIVYPMHGAGIIEAIEERAILGENRKYYILKMPIGEMRVLVPVSHMPEGGLRPVISAEGVEQVFRILGEDASTEMDNWNRRYRHNLEKLKSGDIYELAEVVRNLTRRDQRKGLSTGEKKMLDNARQLLVSELVLAENSSEETVCIQIKTCLVA